MHPFLEESIAQDEREEELLSGSKVLAETLIRRMVAPKMGRGNHLFFKVGAGRVIG